MLPLLGGGPVIPAMDKGAVFDRKVVALLKKGAETAHIPVQIWADAGVGGEGGVWQRSCGGAQTAVLYCPAKYCTAPAPGYRQPGYRGNGCGDLRNAYRIGGTMDMNRLEKLSALYGPSGRESRWRNISRRSSRLGRRICRDAMGNLIVHLGGAGDPMIFAAHMDTVGMMVTRVDQDGYCRFTNVGWLDPASIAHQPVVFENGVTGVVCIPDDKVGKELKLTDLYLDLGAGDRSEAEKLVSVGDIAVFAPRYTENRGRVLAAFLDNRAGCEILLRAMEHIETPKNDVYFVFTVQEEVGTRGAGPAAYGIDGAVGIAVDVTATDDIPGSHP